MRIYLDDIREAPAGFVRAFTAYDAVHLLMTEDVEEISFDHDLGDGYLHQELKDDLTPVHVLNLETQKIEIVPRKNSCVYPYSVGSGHKLALWLEERVYTGQYKKQVLWKIHSANTVGLENIRYTMEAIDRYFDA